jgi:hypothetical protein
VAGELQEEKADFPFSISHFSFVTHSRQEKKKVKSSENRCHKWKLINEKRDMENGFF